ncbi:hypothetical protein [uncultured Pseudokineococcus sp.]|uniref:hypothetical protein n=1 Tax=uncultured Pseudokineococcus sp. TaxID=1642928 RepID=UPI002602FE6A|nr:hypothetical protein [uncultured Pseudokineococcus sp.]
MKVTDPVLAARSRVANLHRARERDPGAIAEAKRDLAAAQLERAIRTALAADLPPSPEQRDRLAALLAGGAR